MYTNSRDSGPKTKPYFVFYFQKQHKISQTGVLVSRGYIERFCLKTQNNKNSYQGLSNIIPTMAQRFHCWDTQLTSLKTEVLF